MKLDLFVLIISLYFLNTVQSKEASVCFPGGGDKKINGCITFTEDDKADCGLYVEVHITCGLSPGKKHPYHIHEYEVYDGDCGAAGGHLDPTGVGKKPDYKCDPKKPSECEVGDLSGKYGDLEADASGMARASYFDPFISLDDENWIVGRSVVIHSAENRTARLACSDIVYGKMHM